MSEASRFDARKLVVAALLAAAAAGSFWVARQVSAPVLLAPAAPRHEPDYIVEGFRATVMNEQGTTRYELRADRLTHFADDGSSELESPYLIQHGEGPPLHTRADRGLMPTGRNHIDLLGNVRASRGRDPKAAGGEITAGQLRVRLDK